MEEKDLSQNPDLEPKDVQSQENSEEKQQPQVSETKKDKIVKSVVKDVLEFRKFDLIHKIYFLILSREAVRRLSVEASKEDADYKTEFKPFIDNYSKSTYVLLRNYFHKENTAKLNEEIDNLAKSFFISGRMASEMYFGDVLFSQRGYEMLKLYLTTTFILPLIKKVDSKDLYNDLKTIHMNSKTKEIITEYNIKQLTLISTLTTTSLDLSYSAYALKKSKLTLDDYNRIDLELKDVDLVVEQERTIPYTEDYDGDKDPEKRGKVHIKVDSDYKNYYKEKIHQVVERFLQSGLSAAQAKYFFVNIDLYLAFAAHLMEHDHWEVGSYIALTLADECSRAFVQNLKLEDFGRVTSLQNIGSILVNKSLTLLYAVGNVVDHHELKGILEQFKERFAVPSEHFMGVTDLKIYTRAFYALEKYGKDGVNNFLNRNAKGNKE